MTNPDGFDDDVLTRIDQVGYHEGSSAR